MKLTRWQPFTPVWNNLQHLQHEMNRIFDRWGEDGGSNLFGFAPAFPAVNVWEDADVVFVEAELPGLKLEDLEIFVTNGNQLTIKGERKPVNVDKGVWHRQERGTGSFVRMLTLPFHGQGGITRDFRSFSTFGSLTNFKGGDCND